MRQVAGRGRRGLPRRPGLGPVQRHPGGACRHRRRPPDPRAARGGARRRNPRGPSRRARHPTEPGWPGRRVVAGRVPRGRVRPAGPRGDGQEQRPARRPPRRPRSRAVAPRRRSPRSTRARAARTRGPSPRQPHPTGVPSRKPHGSPPAPEPMPSATTGRAATRRAVARAEASSEATTRRVCRCARIRDATRDRASARPWPEWWATCQAEATTRSSPAPGVAARRRSASGTSEPRASRLDHGRQARTSCPAARASAAPGGRPAASSAATTSQALEHRRDGRARGAPVAAPPPDQPRRGTASSRRRRRGTGAARPRPSREPTDRPGADQRPRRTRDDATPVAPATPVPGSDRTAPGRPARRPRRPRRARPPASWPVTARSGGPVAGGRPPLDPAGGVERHGDLEARPARRPAGPARRPGPRGDAVAAPGPGGPRRRGRRRAGCARPPGAVRPPAASASIRAGTSAAELACTVPQPPACPVLSAASMSTTSAPRTSPTTSRSGRIRSAWRTSVRRVISPAPSMLGGRASSPMTCGWSGRSSLESSTSTSRSPGSTRESSAASRVVLPVPVPPVTRKAQPGGDDRAPAARRPPRSRPPAATQVVQREDPAPAGPAARPPSRGAPSARAPRGSGCRRAAARRRTAWRRRAGDRRSRPAAARGGAPPRRRGSAPR